MEKMRIEVCKRRHRCSFGVCRQDAEFGILPSRVGIRGAVYVCRECLNSIRELAGQVLIPKSPKSLFDKGIGKATLAEGLMGNRQNMDVSDVATELGSDDGKLASVKDSSMPTAKNNGVEDKAGFSSAVKKDSAVHKVIKGNADSISIGKKAAKSALKSNGPNHSRSGVSCKKGSSKRKGNK